MFLNDGRIELDNNTVEPTIRPIALNRKALFAGHDVGPQNRGIMTSLIETCKLYGVVPHAYLATLTAIINRHMQSDIDQLLPSNHTPNV